MSANTKSAYIHIPFCKSKCKYCSFISTETLDKKLGYLYSLLKEIDYYYDGETLDTIYFGGGTPSVMELQELEKILKKFNFNNTAEITIEVNPNDITKNYINGLKTLGFNRISIGAQSFDDILLKYIGRRHSADEIYKAVELIKADFNNINLDLIYGLPNQTVDCFQKDLEAIVGLNPEHVSLYGLKIDNGCYFYNNPPENLPNEDMQADMYLLANEILSKHGYDHYEISNYSKPNYNSRHNSNYWRCGEYYGFGLSAHGYKDDLRYSNTSNLSEYLNNPTSHEYGKFLTEQEKLEEKIFLGLRLKEGICIEEINKLFNIDFEKKYEKTINKYLKTGHLEKTEKGYSLSDKKDNNGFLISNVILADFL